MNKALILKIAILYIAFMGSFSVSAGLLYFTPVGKFVLSPFSVLNIPREDSESAKIVKTPTSTAATNSTLTPSPNTPVPTKSPSKTTAAPSTVQTTTTTTPISTTNPPPTPTPLPVPPPPPAPAPVQAGSVPNYDHIVLILFENHAYENIVGNTVAPYINGLIPTGAVATKYYATAHPSLPNYLELTSGTNSGITTDCSPGATCTANVTNIADLIENSGRSWKAYQESMPAPCGTSGSGNYVVRHNPFVYFNDIRTNSARCSAHVVPYTQLSTDFNSDSTTPNFSFITPNVCNDMHDCSIATGDTWLSTNLPVILNSPAFTAKSSLAVIVWDEDDNNHGNHVLAVFTGSKVKKGYQSPTNYTHYSLLRSIEASWGLQSLTTNDASTVAMSDIFDNSLANNVSQTLQASGWSIGKLVNEALGILVAPSLSVSNVMADTGKTFGINVDVLGVGTVITSLSNRVADDNRNQAFQLFIFTSGLFLLILLPVILLTKRVLSFALIRSIGFFRSLLQR